MALSDSLLSQTPALIALATGFLLGVATQALHPLLRIKSTPEVDSDSGSDDEAESSDEEHKLVLCVRTDLKMQKGKIAAQVGHATLGAYKTGLKRDANAVRVWERNAQPKIALQVGSEEEAMALRRRAREAGLSTFVVHDAGRTQIAAGSMTVLAVGPGRRSVVDGVTGGLKLL